MEEKETLTRENAGLKAALEWLRDKEKRIKQQTDEARDKEWNTEKEKYRTDIRTEIEVAHRAELAAAEHELEQKHKSAIDQLQTQLSATNTTIASLKKESTESAAQILSLAAENKQLKIDNGELEHSVDEVTNERERRDLKWLEYKSGLDSEVKQLKRTMEEMKVTASAEHDAAMLVTTIQTDRDQLKAELSQTLHRLDELKSQSDEATTASLKRATIAEQQLQTIDGLATTIAADIARVQKEHNERVKASALHRQQLENDLLANTVTRTTAGGGEDLDHTDTKHAGGTSKQQHAGNDLLTRPRVQTSTTSSTADSERTTSASTVSKMSLSPADSSYPKTVTPGTTTAPVAEDVSNTKKIESAIAIAAATGTSTASTPAVRLAAVQTIFAALSQAQLTALADAQSHEDRLSAGLQKQLQRSDHERQQLIAQLEAIPATAKTGSTAASAEGSADSHAATIGALEKALRDLTAQTQARTKERDDEIRSLHEKLLQFEDSLQTQRSEVEAANRTSTALTANVAELKTQVVEKTAAIAELKTQSYEWKETVQRTAKELEQAKGTIAQLSQQVKEDKAVMESQSVRLEQVNRTARHSVPFIIDCRLVARLLVGLEMAPDRLMRALMRSSSL